MTISPEIIKAVGTDPRILFDKESVIERPKLETALITLLHESEQMTINYLVESKAPGSAKITELIKKLAESINDTLDLEEEISENAILELRAKWGQELGFTPEEVSQFLSEYNDYYNFVLAKRGRTVLTLQELARIKEIRANINAIPGLNTVLAIDEFNSQKQDYTPKATDEQLIDYFSADMRFGAEGPKLRCAISDSGIIRVRNLTRYYNDPRATYSTPIDSIDLFPQHRNVIVKNFHLVKGSLKDIKNTVLTELYPNIALMELVFYNTTGRKLRDYKVNYMTVVIDEKNYVGLVALSASTIKACRNKFDQDCDALRGMRLTNNYNSLPGFRNGYLYEL